MNFIPLLQTEPPQGGSSFITMGMFALIFVIFYFFIIRPQNKKQKETERMINSIKKGDRVITIGGMHGEVSAVREKTFVLKVEDGSKIEFNRAAISTVVNKESEKASGKPAKDAKAEMADKTETDGKSTQLSDANVPPPSEGEDSSGKSE